MSTSQVDPALVSNEQVYELAPVLGDRWQMSWTFTAIVGWFAVVFLLINHTPLSLEHTWQHANAGSHVVQNGALPSVVANAPLANGMPTIAESWLFDVGAYVVANRWGADAISGLIALLASAAMWSWCGLVFRVSRSLVLTLVVAIVLAVGWANHYASLQPQLVAMLLLSAVVWTILPARPLGALANDEVDDVDERSLTFIRSIVVAMLFCVWSNIDGSFVIGILLLLSIAVGKAIKAQQENGWRAITSDPETQRWTLLTQFAALATLLNPQHILIWRHAVTHRLDSLVSGLAHGHGLYLPTTTGLVTVALIGFVAYSLRNSASKVDPAELLLTAVMTLVVVASAASIYWAIPILLLVAARHQAVIPTPNVSQDADETSNEERPLRFAGSLLCLLFAWCAFALSTISAPLLGGAKRSPQRMFHAETPLVVGEFLSGRNLDNSEAFGWTSNESPLVWAPSEWSDWLVWRSGGEARLFAPSQLSLLPRRVQHDYAKVFRGESGWDRILNRYAVETLVIDKSRQKVLASEVMRHPQWRLVIETPGSLTLQRASVGTVARAKS